jgi:hypothetical protein
MQPFLQVQFAKLQLILRCCGCGVGERSEHAELEAWSGIECRTFFGVEGFAPKPNF